MPNPPRKSSTKAFNDSSLVSFVYPYTDCTPLYRRIPIPARINTFVSSNFPFNMDKDSVVPSSSKISAKSQEEAIQRSNNFSNCSFCNILIPQCNLQIVL